MVNLNFANKERRASLIKTVFMKYATLLLRLLLLVYATLFIALRVIIFQSGKCLDDTPATERCRDWTARSDQHDFKPMTIQGRVKTTGHLFFDLFWISSFQVETTDGCTFRVYSTRCSPPSGQEPVVDGQFRQFYRGVYGNWFGMVEFDRFYASAQTGLSGQ